jgi:flagellar basal body P-ring protein FlgI
MQETPDGSLPRNDRESRAPRISPAATVLTLAAVAFAVLTDAALAATPQDRLALLQAMRAAGALRAEIAVI